jgi:CRP-like cAMP-binding protein
MESLRGILAAHPFCGGLDDNYIDLLTGCAKNVRFDADEMIFREGDDAAWFYLIREGSVALDIVARSHEPITLQTLSEGDVLGVSWLTPPYRWLFDGRARTAVRAIALDARCLRGKCEADHDLGYHLMRHVSELLVRRLQAARMQLMDLYRIPGVD